MDCGIQDCRTQSYCLLASVREMVWKKSLENILNKGEAIKDLKKEGDTVISIGDGMGDVIMFQESDFSIAFGGIHEPIQTLLKIFPGYKKSCKI